MIFLEVEKIWYFLFSFYELDWKHFLLQWKTHPNYCSLSLSLSSLFARWIREFAEGENATIVMRKRHLQGKDRCQFYQHFTSIFFIRKSFLRISVNTVGVFVSFFAKGNCYFTINCKYIKEIHKTCIQKAGWEC